MEHMCPICQRALSKDDNNKHIDYHCYPPKSDHHYSKRVAPTGELLKMKVRMGSSKDRLYFKINYDEGFTQVWSEPENDESKIRINHVFEPDLTDLEALRQKLRTYMVFS